MTRNELLSLIGSRDQNRRALCDIDTDKVDSHAASLRGANFAHTRLGRARLEESTNLRHADLREANLTGAPLEQADLKGAQITDEQLDNAGSLDDAILPNGPRHGA